MRLSGKSGAGDDFTSHVLIISNYFTKCYIFQSNFRNNGSVNNFFQTLQIKNRNLLLLIFYVF